MTAKHTPGPWAVCTDATGDTFIASMTDSAETVCELGAAFDNEGQAHLEADAHLIAAAPDLLAIAERLLERGYVSAHIGEEADDHMALIAAIAKARGVA